MGKKRKKRNKKYSGPKTLKKPISFDNFATCVKWLKRSVYLIVRGRKTKIKGQEGMQWITLGSGFIAAPKRMITASHVINNPKKNKLTQHQDGDKYYLLRHDDDSNWHSYIFEPKMNSDIYLYPDLDLAIIYLNNNFYKKEGKVFVDENDFIKVSKDFLPIGSEIGVLGYPLCKLNFKDADFAKPQIGNVLMRTDKGVINCRFKTSKFISAYEFTLVFNPGNSGGPIFDTKTGEAISIVKGFKTIPISQREIEIPKESAKLLKTYTEKAYIETLNATYSIGFSTTSFTDILKQHNIIN